MDGIDISVIVPVYNLERFLNPLLETLKNQDLGDYKSEVFFVLNNCTDKSEDVIRNSELDCTILYCETQGCGPARNTAMDVATGRYIWFVDGDDWFLTNTALKDAIEMADRDNLNILKIPYDTKAPYPYFSMVWQYLLRRDFVDEFRFPNYQPHEDVDFMEKVLNKAGYRRDNFMDLPHLDHSVYYYNYLREGSNMYRLMVLGEKI